MSEEMEKQMGQDDVDDADEGGKEQDEGIIEEARADGWRPLEEYTGPKDRWVDAETFVKRGREIMPILHKNNERLKKEMAGLQAELETTKTSLKKVQEYHTQLEQRAYDRAVKDLKAERKAAMEAQDFGTVADLDEELDELKKEAPKAEPKEEPKQAAPELDPVLVEWMDENKAWFNDSNRRMVHYANAIGMELSQTNPELKGRAFLNEIKKEVKAQFPEKFQTKREAPGMFEGGRGSGGGGSGSSGSISDLPREAQQACKELAKEDWYRDLAKSLKLTPEQLYLRDYEA